MSYCYREYVPGGSKGQGETSEFPSLSSESSEAGKREQTRNERCEEGLNKKLRDGRSFTSGRDKFTPHHQYASRSRKVCSNTAKTTKNLGYEHNQSETLLSTENTSRLRSRTVASKTELGFDRSLDKKVDNLEEARNAHREKFRATLDSLMEEMESGAFSTRAQALGMARVSFRVHYVTHSPTQLLAVTGSQHELGAWESFVPLRRAERGFWVGTVLLPTDSQAEWKFVLVDNGKIQHWEGCRNRHLLILGQVKEIQLSCKWGYP